MKFLSFFRRIQWKLTISYAVVTAGTVIVLAGMMVGLAIFAEGQTTSRTFDSFFWSKTGFQDNIPFIKDDPEVLQEWLTRVQSSGFNQADFKSYTVRETLDYANTLLYGTHPIYVLDPELNLVAAEPGVSPSWIGKPFTSLELNGFYADYLLESALVGDKNYYEQSQIQPDGSYVVAFPLRKTDDDPISAIVVYYIKPVAFATPTNLSIYTTFFVITAIIILVVSLPVGAVFGGLVSRGFSKRLKQLSKVSQAWSTGDFSVKPRDHSGDEIGDLTRNLNGMADQLQTLLQTHDELARVEERNRLARDLHDTVKQQTYATRMQLSAAKNLINTEPQTAAEHIEAALQLNRETQQELKQIIEELRPAALEGKGLSLAITDYLKRWQTHTGINTEIQVRGDRFLPITVEQVLYRVMQEALSNVARHAEGDFVRLTLNSTNDDVVLTINDNGRGFDLDSVSLNSLGIVGMKQRLKEINGDLSIESVLAMGTKIIAKVNFIKK